MTKTLRRLAVGVAATVTIVTARPAAASEATIVVRVDNLMKVPADSLRKAQEEASQAYEAIGVSLIWLKAGGASDVPAGDRVLDVLLGTSIRMRRASRDALGFAPLHTNRAYIFVDRVARLAVSQRDFEVVLGQVLAHELGHLLLPGQGHSDIGIMQKQVDHRSASVLGFTEDQRWSIQVLLASN